MEMHHETVQSGNNDVGALVLLDGERICRPSLHLDGFQGGDPYHPRSATAIKKLNIVKWLRRQTDVILDAERRFI